MRQVAELLEVGIYETIDVKNGKTVGELVKELGLTEMFGVLVNGRKVEDVSYRINETDKVVILPILAGG